jgi:hypothetical protein
MRIVCVDIIIGMEIYRAMALHKLGRALWAAMVARFTLDVRLIAEASRHLAAAAANWLLVETLCGPLRNEPYE